MNDPQSISGVPTVDVVDLRPLCGQWINTWSESRWLAAFRLYEADTGCAIELIPSGELLTSAHLSVEGFVDADGKLAFLAKYERGNASCVLAGNMNQSLAIIAGYYRPDPDAGDPPQFFREFFYQSSAGE